MTAQTYVPIVLSNDESLGWIALGAGPLFIQNITKPYQDDAVYISLFFGTAAPQAEDLGFFVKLSQDSPFKVDTGMSVWSICAFPNISVLVVPESSSEAASATALGTTADAAWAGTGDGSVIAILKSMALKAGVGS